MDLDSLIIAVFCLVDDALPQAVPGRLRQRGPQPLLADAEVLTIEVVGEYLGLDREAELFAYFGRHYAHFFPALADVHRTTFTRQAANLWKIKERLWQHLLGRTGCDPRWAMVSRPVQILALGSAVALAVFASRVVEPWNGVAQRIAVTLALSAEILVAVTEIELAKSRTDGETPLQ